MMKIRESALTPFASTSHFMNFGLKSSGFSCSELSFFEDEYGSKGVDQIVCFFKFWVECEKYLRTLFLRCSPLGHGP